MNQNELYDLKYHISYYILPRLKAFKEKVDNNIAPSIPEFNDEFKDNKPSLEELEKHWKKILEQMIFPFEYYVKPENFKNLNNDEIKKKIRIGLKHFSNHFEDLWF